MSECPKMRNGKREKNYNDTYSDKEGEQADKTG
jgi:hypothetical protein